MLRLFGKLIWFDPWPTPDKLLALQRTRELWLEEYGTEMDAEPFCSQLNDPLAVEDDNDRKLKSTDVDPKLISSVYATHYKTTVPSVASAIANRFCTFAATGPFYTSQVRIIIIIFHD